MRYETIADIYSANQKIRDAFTATVGGVSAEESIALPDGEKWSIQQLVEHVAIVEQNISRICVKLVDEAKAAGKASDGTVRLSEDFGQKTAAAAGVKVEAPERVHPTGNVTISDALAQMSETGKVLAGLRADYEAFDCSEAVFPHPFFGPLSAIEWLVLIGGHEARHTRQLEQLLDKIRT